MIEVKNVTKRYGEKTAVKGLSFTVRDGEVLGFLGPNGAGKSTTMNIITGYLSATEGSVTVDGVDVFENPKLAKSKIGYLPELPPLYLDMTVEEYLDFIYDLKKCKMPRRAHLEEICREVRIEDVRKRVIKNLSKGYRQRVGVAGALVGDPDVLILDEPTVGLDPAQIIDIRNLIKRLGETRTVILSSHILSEVEAVCERVIVINKGVLIADDTPDNLSRALSGGGTVTVRVAGDGGKALELLSSLGCSESVERKECRERGASEFNVKPRGGGDIRPLVASCLVNGGCEILGLRFLELSLEDIFLTLISGEEDRV